MTSGGLSVQHDNAKKTVGGVYTNYTVESIDTEPIV